MLACPPLEGRRIFIVDDEPQVVAALTDLLEDDYDVVSETSPLAALKRLREEDEFSVILSDQRMPGMQGDEFLAKARAHTEAMRVLVTGYADLEAVIRAVNEGKIYGYLTKPWDAPALLKTVKDAIDSFELNQQLERERALFDDLMRSISDGVFVKDAEGRYERINEAEARLMKLDDPRLALGKTLEELVAPELAQKWAEDERLVLKTGRRGLRNIRELRNADGEKRSYSVSLSARRDPDDEITGLVGVSREITEERNIQQIKSEFISTVSHELRTPLTSIIGALSLLRASEPDAMSDQARSLVENCSKNGARLLSLINDILDLDKIDSGALDVSREPLAVADILTEAVGANEGYGSPDGKRIEIASPTPDVRVHGDMGRLLQVLANLISNALKYTEPGGKVRIRANLVGDYVRFSVIDLGGGIPEKFRDRIFTRFAQSDSSDTRAKGGSGLGLNISRSIIELHDGRMGFYTRANVGSKFYFELPVMA